MKHRIIVQVSTELDSHGNQIWYVAKCSQGDYTGKKNTSVGKIRAWGNQHAKKKNGVKQ